ncbi:integrase core domain-containing protein [Thorsellia anophelis]|uniref:Integrase core domain-containing protein n=1 Tax=Thorsellia anophelis DSM 18579 TaxID=1123402 RepID=A0A1I0DHT9_9GAMM|nr:integrase core domain-containing protein [Thorsellia anophelis]SET32024.1 Integrase core domain-containing protein [Thorsellia anophelis DSM 18579]
MKAKLEQLGIIASYSRSAVSNDNAFSESLFGSMKTRKQYPRQGFRDIEEAREWVLSFVYWYNNEHRHSGIKYVTPAQRHQGIDGDILAKRKEVYRVAKLTFPERWNTRDTRDWDYEDEIVFNPVKENKANSSEKNGQVA